MDRAKQAENVRQNNIIEETGIVVAVEYTVPNSPVKSDKDQAGIEVVEVAEEAGDLSKSRIEFANIGFISLGGADDNDNSYVEGNEPLDVDKT